MPIDMSRIGTAEDVNVDAARQGTGGIAGMQDLCTADLQVLARPSVLALVEQRRADIHDGQERGHRRRVSKSWRDESGLDPA